MSITRLQRNPLLEVVLALPDIALHLGMVGWGCWLMADGLVGPDPLTGRLRLEAPVFRPVVEMSEAIIHNPVANDALQYGSLVCGLAGAGVIGLRHFAFYWEVSRGKDGKGNSDQD
ncbi:hypothetical protein [Acaryochloris sp. CCMEE 5410]|uniref:hypothetical protein n=1 Tax=Acaryochloris sp. CCMEE 5410 TaxID=310037 RepID=UPI0002484930|nr:hypothetical protein [Acaryochloris sp. CCMEE 5410]KAI9129008.1 hypothetical protein ON05_037215 [Acaryochloris sp. CCMEE 5410]